MLKKTTLSAIFVMFCGLVGIFPGPFTFINDLEIGLGFGYNVNYWSLGTSKLAPRAIAAGGEGIQRGVNAFANDLRNRLQAGRNGALAFSAVELTNLEGSGRSLTIDGVNIDTHFHYHIFPWLFLRTGLTVDIPIPVSYSVSTNFEIKLSPVQPIVATLAETGIYEVDGLDMEIPILLGFNLISLGQFSVYGAIGLNLTFGGYSETLSATTTLNIAGDASDTVRAQFADLNLDSPFTSVVNKYNVFQMGLGWLFGFKYKPVKHVSIFAEMKWLNSSSLLTITGTNDVGTINSATSNAPIAGVLNTGNGNVTTDNQIRTLGDASSASNVVSTLTRTYNARWVIGSTFGFHL